ARDRIWLVRRDSLSAPEWLVWSEKMKLSNRYSGLILPVLVVAALTLWPVITGKPANRESAFTILKAIALASSLNILLGYTGYVSFGHIVFYGFGGYVGIFLLTEQEWSLWTAIIAGGIASGILAFLLGSAILRLRGAYFALATIGVNEAMRAFINNFELFGGPTGITLNFSVYKTYGGAAQALQMSFYIGAGLAMLALVLSYIIRSSKFGLGLLAIRENEDAAEVMGVVAPTAKTWAYVFSAIVPGMIGVLFFFKNGNVEPHDAFPLHASIELLVMVMLGGQGTVLGPILGAFAYQGMRGYLVTSPIFKNIQLSVSGALLLMIVLFIPAGAIGWLRHRIPVLRRVLA
ncbi:MAG TPA: branched-chain amino acid ABC transporter permease, partial [Anaerolineales bacterium]|nr:branched-chain amino acid ABC transporter permease [Anaerolineales bacterium]